MLGGAYPFDRRGLLFELFSRGEAKEVSGVATSPGRFRFEGPGEDELGTSERALGRVVPESSGLSLDSSTS